MVRSGDACIIEADLGEYADLQRAWEGSSSVMRKLVTIKRVKRGLSRYAELCEP